MSQAAPQANESQKDNRFPTVSRVLGDTIVELVYDPKKRKTALAISRFGGLWNIEGELRVSVETYVPYSAHNNLIRTECVLLPSEPVHHGDKTALISAIEAYLCRYVALSPLFLQIAAHYVLLSWVYDAFNELPYLRLQGNFGTGKTRALVTIGSIMYKPFFASGASTVSPIFHILETFAGSLVLDEADFRFTDATNELVKILNNGTTRGLPILRTMQNQHKELNPQAFRVFGPKIVAMRTAYQDRGLESRFVSEDMNAIQLRTGIPLHLPNELRDEALALRNQLLHYRFTNLFSTRLDPTLAAAGLPPRVNQLALPLLSIVDEPRLRRDIQRMIGDQALARPRERDEIALSAVVIALVEEFDVKTAAFITVGDLAKRVNAMRGDAPYATKYIGHLLRDRLGIPAHKSRGVFVVSRDALPEIRTKAKRLGIDSDPRAGGNAHSS